MSITIDKNNRKEDRMMRDVYCESLMALSESDKRVVAIDADLMKSMGMIPFMKKYPERTFNCGVQEANMVGVAAGLSATGKIPFAHTFGVFATRRCYDQVFLSAAYSKLNVRIVGSDPGITAAYNGGTHMPFEDMGIMRNIPGITLIEPVDNAMLADIIRQVKDMYGVFYIRLMRKEPICIYKMGSKFNVGKGITLEDGNDVTIIASGYLVSDTLKAARLLEEQGVSARVINIFTWKPIDVELIIKCAKETGAIVTVENHNIINGLGSAVAEVLAEHIPTPMERIGSQDKFGQVGPVEYLQKAYEMTTNDIVKKVLKVIERK